MSRGIGELSGRRLSARKLDELAGRPCRDITMNRPRTGIPVSDQAERWSSRGVRLTRGDDSALGVQDEERLELKPRGERRQES